MIKYFVGYILIREFYKLKKILINFSKCLINISILIYLFIK